MKKMSVLAVSSPQSIPVQGEEKKERKGKPGLFFDEDGHFCCAICGRKYTRGDDLAKHKAKGRCELLKGRPLKAEKGMTNVKVECPCGKTLVRSKVMRHFKSKVHCAWFAKDPGNELLQTSFIESLP